MRVEYLADGVTLYCGDCRELLPTLPRPDAIITDPPYGIGFVHSGGSGSSGIVTKRGRDKYRTQFANVAIIGDDRPFDPAFLLAAADHVLLWGGNHYADKLPPSPNWLIWDKRSASHHVNNFADCELAWVSWKGVARMFRHHWDGAMRASENQTRRVHPMQKPVKLMEWCLTQLPKGVRRIADPFMGSGSTGIAAIKHGLGFVGIELEEKYFDIACKRLGKAVARPDLFVATREVVTQTMLPLG